MLCADKWPVGVCGTSWGNTPLNMVVENRRERTKMNRRITVFLLAGLGALTLSAQVEVLPGEVQQQWLKNYQSSLSQKTPFQAHLKNVSGKTVREKINAARVAADFAGLKTTPKVVHYQVDPMSETQYLPDVYPFDGCAGMPVRIIAAQDEYEPGSFILYPLETAGKTAFEVSDLKMADGTVFSKKDLDLKTVKVWYQNGNGWYSYFQDKALKLCPELLLNDEDLIKVDTKNVCNWARLTEQDGKVSYRWLNPPPKADTRVEDAPLYSLKESFQCMKPNFADAATFQGATLNEGEFKQFYLTAHVKTGQKPGLYEGCITLKKGNQVVGTVPVELKVLPFVLPKPMTYRDPDKEFLTYMYTYLNFYYLRQFNGNDQKLAERQLVAILKDWAEHGETMPHYREDLLPHPEFARAAGCDMSHLIFFQLGRSMHGNPAELKFYLRRLNEDLKEKFGKCKSILTTTGDEYNLDWLVHVRKGAKLFQEAGFRVQGNSHFTGAYGTYFIDTYNPAIRPDMGSSAAAFWYNDVDPHSDFGWYGNMHVGVENPAWCRRMYGLAPYRAGFTCNFNYAQHLDGWNDLIGSGYKPMNFVYGSGTGCIDTISFEGFREGLDDIRYATLLQRLARPLLTSKNIDAVYAARKAMQCLADLDHDDYNITTARMEIIRHILKLQKFSK